MQPPRLLPAIAATVAVALLAACGSGPTGSTSSTIGSPAGDSAAARPASFPVTVTHAYGTTTIQTKPERVATVAWANHEVPLALGVVPVGMSKAAWGDDDGDGVLPWVEEKLAALGAETPVLFDEADGIDFEAVAGTQPDVILAAYSGLTREDYDTLSKIAPVVAFPEVPWGTSVQDMIRLDSTALGLAAEGDELVARLDARTAASLARHPQLKGKSVVFTYVDPKDTSKIGFYTAHDTRPGFLASIGMVNPKLVQERSAATSAFYDTISAEQGDRLADADIVVTYGAADGSTPATLKADALLSKIPAISRGSVAVLQDSTPLAASANPSPLSIGWGIDRYLDLLAGAADKAGNGA
jgi:iron complex transport system substrate-binding protein